MDSWWVLSYRLDWKIENLKLHKRMGYSVHFHTMYVITLRLQHFLIRNNISTFLDTKRTKIPNTLITDPYFQHRIVSSWTTNTYLRILIHFPFIFYYHHFYIVHKVQSILGSLHDLFSSLTHQHLFRVKLWRTVYYWGCWACLRLYLIGCWVS